MNRLSTFILIVNIGLAAAYGQQRPVKMSFSGTTGASAFDLKQPDTTTGEDNFAGSGSHGSFTFRNLRAITKAPQPSSTCTGPTKVYFSSSLGAGVFRFQDGSLLKVRLIEGGDCIDFIALQAECTVKFQIIGGTERFQGASGTVTLTETVVPVLGDALGNPVFFTSTGEITGSISGVGAGKDDQLDAKR
jgi:hypothetical protein